MSAHIKHSNGHTATADSLQAAIGRLRREYPDMVHDIAPERTLVWACEQDSENDPGTRAVAEIIGDAPASEPVSQGELFATVRQLETLISTLVIESLGNAGYAHAARLAAARSTLIDARRAWMAAAAAAKPELSASSERAAVLRYLRDSPTDHPLLAVIADAIERGLHHRLPWEPKNV